MKDQTFTIKVENLYRGEEAKTKYVPFICVYDKYGQYIGSYKWLEKLIKEYRIIDTIKNGGNTVSVCKTKEGYIGFSHRALYHFKVGDKIKYNKDLLILTHGYMPGCKQYKREKKQIEKIRKMFKNGVLYIKDRKTALMLAKRFADSVS